MSKTKFSNIPNELVENILLKLPVKSLKRLSSVNKLWYSIIRSSLFISRHYSYHSSRTEKLLIKYEPHDISSREDLILRLSKGGDGNHHHYYYSDLPIPIPFFRKENRVEIIGPCINGIVCLKDFYDEIALWNIATREYKTLPKCGFSYDPTKVKVELEGLGFGWVQETNEYKVVISVEFWDTEYITQSLPSPRFFVYELSTNCWKQISSYQIPNQACAIDSSPPYASQIYFNGVCFWVNQIPDKDISKEIFKIFSFHVRDEVFGSIELPSFESNDLDCFWFSLSILDDSIALIMNQIKEIEFSFEIWVMTVDESSWIKRFKIGSLFNIEVGLGFLKDEELFLEDHNGELLLINLNSKKIENLGIRGVKNTIQVLRYVESLVSLKKI